MHESSAGEANMKQALQSAVTTTCALALPLVVEDFRTVETRPWTGHFIWALNVFHVCFMVEVGQVGTAAGLRPMLSGGCR